MSRPDRKGLLLDIRPPELIMQLLDHVVAPIEALLEVLGPERALIAS